MLLSVYSSRLKNYQVSLLIAVEEETQVRCRNFDPTNKALRLIFGLKS